MVIVQYMVYGSFQKAGASILSPRHIAPSELLRDGKEPTKKILSPIAGQALYQRAHKREPPISGHSHINDAHRILHRDRTLGLTMILNYVGSMESFQRAARLTGSLVFMIAGDCGHALVNSYSLGQYQCGGFVTKRHQFQAV